MHDDGYKHDSHHLTPYTALRNVPRSLQCPLAGGGWKKIRAWKKISRGVRVPGLAREKKMLQYFHSIWNFFLQGVGGQISCGKLVNVAALQFVTLLTMNDFNLFSCICGYCALSCGVEERLFVRGGLL